MFYRLGQKKKKNSEGGENHPPPVPALFVRGIRPIAISNNVELR